MVPQGSNLGTMLLWLLITDMLGILMCGSLKTCKLWFKCLTYSYLNYPDNMKSKACVCVLTDLEDQLPGAKNKINSLMLVYGDGRNGKFEVEIKRKLKRSSFYK